VNGCLKVNFRHTIFIAQTAMSTLLPPKAKRVKREELQRAREQVAPELVPEDVPNVVVQLRASDTGAQLGGELHIPGNATAQQLDQLVNKLLGTVILRHTLLSLRSDRCRKTTECLIHSHFSRIRQTPTLR
jgi:hypothetical protein